MSKQYLICFPGQGSQSLSMAQELPQGHQRSYYEALKKIDFDFEEIINKNPDLINETTRTQPAILAHSYLTFKHYENLWTNCDLTFIGHSLGELTAACLSFGLTLDQSCQLAQKRAQLMKAPFEKDSLQTKTVALLGEFSEELEKEMSKFSDIWAINYNSPTQTVITGFTEQIDLLLSLIKEKRLVKKAVPLSLSISSHCPLLKPVVEQWFCTLEETFAGLSPKFPVGSNRTTTLHHNKDDILNNLAYQLIEPVRYHDLITHYLQSTSPEKIIEIGPGKVLTGLHRRLKGSFELLTSHQLHELQGSLIL